MYENTIKKTNMPLDVPPKVSESASNKERMLSSKTACRGFEPFCPCHVKFGFFYNEFELIFLTLCNVKETIKR